MNKKELPKEISSSDFDEDIFPNDYEDLISKLKSIKESIIFLEKKLLVK